MRNEENYLIIIMISLIQKSEQFFLSCECITLLFSEFLQRANTTSRISSRISSSNLDSIWALIAVRQELPLPAVTHQLQTWIWRICFCRSVVRRGPESLRVSDHRYAPLPSARKHNQSIMNEAFPAPGCRSVGRPRGRRSYNQPLFHYSS